MKNSIIRRGKKLLRLVRNAYYRRGLFHGVAAAIEHESLLRSLNIRTLVDIGANIGQFSLLARSLHPQLVIHAFEPLSGAAARFRSLFRDDNHVTLHCVAAGETNEDAEIHVSGHPDSSSLLPITTRQDELFPGTAEASVERISVARVDDVIGQEPLTRPLMIKLDVQGFELAALKGMPEMLARCDYVYVEVSYIELYRNQPLADEVIAWLREKGFRLCGVYNGTFTRSGRSVQSDMLFVSERSYIEYLGTLSC